MEQHAAPVCDCCNLRNVVNDAMGKPGGGRHNDHSVAGKRAAYGCGREAKVFAHWHAHEADVEVLCSLLG